MNNNKILITAALPYANGSIHIGHMVEYTQADIWARVQKLKGKTCYFVCADDAHGTPIMLKARELGVSEQDIIDKTKKEHEGDFKDFLIEFDNYHSTHSDENKFYAEDIYNKIKQKGYIKSKIIQQAYDEKEQMFLPDRFIKGICPKCKAVDQYGDSCEKCGATYNPSDLIDACSTISGTTPTQKESEHLFFQLSKKEDMLKKWTNAGHIQDEIKNKINEWFETGLKDWDISRDAPYWGFKIPDTVDKYFYVWLDAPIGYMASFKNLCDKSDLDFAEFWHKNSECELYHFIGKDIAYFHTLFWPAMLDGADYRTPTQVFCHGFLTVNGEKMSKSRGTFIKADTYLKYLPAEYLRYYFAAKLNFGVDDIDLNLEDFKTRINSDLIGKLINIASRTAGFVKKFDLKLGAEIDNKELLKTCQDKSSDIIINYQKRNYAKAIRQIMDLADLTNQYIAKMEPWILIKDDKNRQQVLNICTTALNVFKILMIYLKPVLPDLSKKCEDFFNLPPQNFNNINDILLNHKINKFKPMLQRIEQSQIDDLLNDKS
ncbi:MAG: methionine--tRNA ligase [Gammaproteobacteria bacterium]|nr:MAG: methionine--tRNA ligase [Gammaproteobacteria bacterium]